MRVRSERLTVLVAGLSEGFAFGENDGDSQILERGDVEQAGVLVVQDVMFVHFCAVFVRQIQVRRLVTGAGGRRGGGVKQWMSKATTV